MGGGRLNFHKHQLRKRVSLNGRTFGKTLIVAADDPIAIEVELQREADRIKRANDAAFVAAADPKRVRELNRECRDLRRSGQIEWKTDYVTWVADRLKAETDGLSLQ